MQVAEPLAIVLATVITVPLDGVVGIEVPSLGTVCGVKVGILATC